MKDAVIYILAGYGTVSLTAHILYLSHLAAIVVRRRRRERYVDEWVRAMDSLSKGNGK